MSVGLFNAVRVVSSFGSVPYILLDVDPSGDSSADLQLSQCADSPTFSGIWCGQFIGARSVTDCNVGFDPTNGNSFFDAQPGPGNANRADCEIGFHGTNFPIVRTHLSSAAVKGLLFFDDGTRAPPAQPTLTGILGEIAAVTDANAKAALTKLLSVIDATNGCGLCKAT